MDLSSMFLVIHDPRRATSVKHSLENILFISMAAVIGGADGWNEVEEFGRTKEPFFRSQCPDLEGIPSHDTFNRVFSLIAPEVFEEAFRGWMLDICGRVEGVVAIDGKELRGARTQRGDGSFEPLRMVSAWSAANGVSLGQVRVSEKSNEITAIPALVRALDLEGCLVTIDAMGCQREITDAVVSKGGDFLICLKGNQGRLHRTVSEWFDGERGFCTPEGCEAADRLQTFTTQEEGHGRREKRTCTVFSAPLLPDMLKWENVNSIARIRRETTCLASGDTREETRYYISSLGLQPERIARAARAHWDIENKLHWQLDVSFREDDDRKRGNAAQNFSLVRKFALFALNHTKKKASVKRKRKMAGWDNGVLLEVMNGLLEVMNKPA